MGCSSEEEKCSWMHPPELPGGFCTQKLFLLGVCSLLLCSPSTVQPPRALVGAIPPTASTGGRDPLPSEAESPWGAHPAQPTHHYFYPLLT